MKPALRFKLLRRLRVTQAVLLIVRFQQILNNRSRLPQRDARIGIFDSRDSSIRVEGFEIRFLEVGKVHYLRFVFELELFEDDGDFPWVRSLLYNVVSN